MLSVAHRALLFGGRPFVPPDRAPFVKYGASGFLHNFGRTDRTYQESTGVTLADDAIEAVGLALEESRWSGKTLAQIISEATEKITNGSFVTNDLTGWTNNSTGTGSASGATAAAVLIGTDGSNRGQIAQGYSTVVGRLYRMSWAGVLNSGGITVAKSDAAASQSNAVAVTLVTGVMYYIATATTTYFRALTDTGGGNGSIDNVSVKEIAGNHAIQSASTSFRPVRQAGGCIRFDGTDDNLLSTLNPAAAMTLAVRMKATAADRMVLGARQVTNGRGFIYVHSTGIIAGGVGAQGAATIQGGSSILNTTGVAVLTWDGSTVNLYWNGVLVYTGAQSGTPDTTVPLRLGALNDNGTASTFYAGDIFQALAIQAAITPAEVAALSSYWSTL